jgi:hypothetical protein
LAFSIAALAVSASAQTVTGSGTAGTIPVFTGGSTIGNSIITQSNGNINIAGSRTVSANPTAISTFSNYNSATFTAYTWDAITSQLTNPSTSVNTEYYGYVSAPAITTTDGTSRYVIGGDFGPSLVAGGGSSGNHLYGIVGSAFIGSPSNTGGFTSLNGGAFSAGTGPTVPAGTIVSAVNVATLSPLVDSGSVTAVRGLWVTPQFGSTSGPANLKIPSYYGLELGTPAIANGATITNNYGISQEDTTAKNYLAGNVGIGTTTPGAKLEVDGNLKLTGGSGASITFQDGTTQSTAFTGTTCGGDFAESVDVSGIRAKYEPGDVLVIDPNAPGRFLKSAEAYSTAVLGIYSTKPGTVGRRQATPKSPDEVPMAMVGIVPTKVSAENGAIKPGDLLVTASIPGYAMKGTDRLRMLGAVIGKALGTWDTGTGVIEVGVTLQ